MSHNPRCAIFNDPPSLRMAKDCDCGAIPPLKAKTLEVPDNVRREIERLQAELAKARMLNDQQDDTIRLLKQARERAEQDNEAMRDLLYGEPDKFGILGVVPRLEQAEKALQGLVETMDRPAIGIAHARAVEDALNEARATLNVLQSLGPDR
jgi:hypothetical protein